MFLKKKYHIVIENNFINVCIKFYTKTMLNKKKNCNLKFCSPDW